MRKYSLLIVFAFVLNLGLAQNAVFQVSEKIYNLPDTVSKGSTYIFGTYVKNIGTPYTGNFHYRLSVYDWTYGCYCATMEETIPMLNFSVGDSAFIQFKETFNVNGNSKYRMGGNIVVIWPKNSMNYSVTNDEAYHTFTIVNSTNSNNINSIRNHQLTSEEESFENTIAQPNPFENEIIVNADQKFSIQKITLINMQGQIVKEFETSNSYNAIKVSTEDIGKGIYFLNILQENQEQKLIRIIKYKD